MTMASGVYGNFLEDAITNVKAFALNASDTIKISLVTDTHTPNFDTHDEFADITNEITGTGYTAGGPTLASSTWGISSTFVVFDANDISLSTTTLTNVRGGVLYDDTLSGDPLCCAITFGADFSTTAGTFAVTHSASGIWRVSFA